MIQWYKPDFSSSNCLEMTIKTKSLLQFRNGKNLYIFLILIKEVLATRENGANKATINLFNEKKYYLVDLRLDLFMIYIIMKELSRKSKAINLSC